MNPYIVTRRPDACPEGMEGCRCVGHSRRAVATLDEARSAAFDVCMAALEGDGPSDPKFAHQANALPESGGTIGPLPDGTVIEVERVELSRLAKTLVPSSDDRAVDLTELWSYGEIIDAYNIAQRLEELRTELRAERISYGELAELQSLAKHIRPGDLELLEAAGVPEFPEERPL